MFYVKEDDMDDLLRRAAENYSVDAERAHDWESIQAAIEETPAARAVVLAGVQESVDGADAERDGAGARGGWVDEHVLPSVGVHGDPGVRTAADRAQGGWVEAGGAAAGVSAVARGSGGVRDIW